MAKDSDILDDAEAAALREKLARHQAAKNEAATAEVEELFGPLMKLVQSKAFETLLEDLNTQARAFDNDRRLNNLLTAVARGMEALPGAADQARAVMLANATAPALPEPVVPAG